jgi:peptide/nickel transport system permease protein
MSDQTVQSAEATLEQPLALIQAPPARARFALLFDALRLGRTRVGLAIVTALVLVALVGPLVAPYSPTEFVGIPNSPPSGDAIFGTDALGRDVLSRFLHGGRTVLWLAAAATLLGVTLGVIVGLIAAYARNWLDDVLMRGNDVLLAFPQIIFVLLAVSAIGPKLWLIVLTVGLTHAPRVARVIRGAALEVVERDFVKSAEVVGEARWRIVFAEVLPNVTSPLLVEIGLRMTYSIGLIAGISFLGFGLQPPDADWGLMINENRLSITVQPWAVLLPVIAIGLLTIGTNLITDGLSRALAGIDRRSDS